MKHRKLRIAWSVAWGVVAVLLVALWVRSYWRTDGISGDLASEFVYLDAYRGKFYYSRCWPDGVVPWTSTPWHIFDTTALETDLANRMSEGPESHHRFGIAWNTCANGWEISIGIWLLVAIIGVLATISWLPIWPDRFSLRTLLIATTLVAVGLGLIAWLR